MAFKTLSRRQAQILLALGRGMIPAGGPHFALGAVHVADQWLARADYAISRMPFLTQLGIRLLLVFVERGPGVDHRGRPGGEGGLQGVASPALFFGPQDSLRPGFQR